METAVDTVRRSAGRPRDARVEEAILAAATELIEQHGTAGLVVEEVARRAGVSKATIYRRWRRREELVLAVAARSGPVAGVFPDNGSLDADLDALVDDAVVFLTSPLGREILLMVASLQTDTALRASFFEHHIEPLSAHLGELVRRAERRGEIHLGDDVERLTDILIGAWLYKLLLVPPALDLKQEMREMLHALFRRGGGPVEHAVARGPQECGDRSETDGVG